MDKGGPASDTGTEPRKEATDNVTTDRSRRDWVAIATFMLAVLEIFQIAAFWHISNASNNSTKEALDLFRLSLVSVPEVTTVKLGGRVLEMTPYREVHVEDVTSTGMLRTYLQNNSAIAVKGGVMLSGMKGGKEFECRSYSSGSISPGAVQVVESDVRACLTSKNIKPRGSLTIRVDPILSENNSSV